MTRTKRQRDISRACGMVTSIQEIVGSDIAFAAIIHMAQPTTKTMLRCGLGTRSMVSVTTAKLDAPIIDGGTQAPHKAGIGIEPDMEVLGGPIASYNL